jgi:hypothetical protein
MSGIVVAHNSPGYGLGLYAGYTSDICMICPPQPRRSLAELQTSGIMATSSTVKHHTHLPRSSTQDPRKAVVGAGGVVGVGMGEGEACVQSCCSLVVPSCHSASLCQGRTCSSKCTLPASLSMYIMAVVNTFEFEPIRNTVSPGKGD